MFLQRNQPNTPAIRSLVAIDMAEELLQTQMRSLPTSSVIGISCAAMMHSDTMPLAPAAWLLLFLIINFIRYFLMKRFKKTPRSAESAAKFLRHALVFNFIIGLEWALIPIFFVDLTNPNDSILLVIVTGICAGAAVQSASYAAGATAIIIPIMSVIFMKFFLINNRNSFIMTIDIVLYFFFLTGAALRVEGMVFKMIRLNKDANALAGSLEKEHAESLEKAARLYVIANHDPLTGLANRAALANHLTSTLKTALERGQSFLLLLLDLDHFKSINDTLGHSAGDCVLMEVAARFSSSISDEDIAARLGGDEFAIILNCPGALLDEAAADDSMRLAAERIMASVCGPFQIGDRLINIAASVGVAAFPRDGTNSDELFANADLALYAAKDGGRHRWRRFDAALLAAAKMTRDIEHDLPAALKNGALDVWYQPQIALSSGRLCGLEALLRWEHPVHGWIDPPSIVIAALRIHASHQLTGFVLRQACQTLHALDRLGWPDVTVAVNISPREIEKYDVPELVKGILEDHGLDPARVELEITEEAFAASEKMLASLKTLSALGLPLAIDDFGTGCSSIAYLRSMPVNRLKIDRVFITGLANHAEDRILVQAILGIGRSFGIEVVAEGVESAEEAALLQAYGCHIVQGYYFGRPMADTDLYTWLAGRTEDKRSSEDTSGNAVSVIQEARAVA